MGTFDNAGSSDDLYVTGNLEVDGSVWLGDATADNITITGTLIQEGGATFGNVRIAEKDDQTIDTSVGILVLDSYTDTLDINTSLIDLSTQATTIALADVVEALNIDSDTFTIDALNNRVGIGTTAPGAKLSSLSTVEQLRLNYDSTKYTSFTTGSGGDLIITPTGGDTAITGDLEVSGGLNVAGGDLLLYGINKRIVVYDDRILGFGGGSGTQDVSLGWNSADNTFRIANGTDLTSSPWLTFDSSGNVGIGTASPGQKLDIKSAPADAMVAGTAAGHLFLTNSGGSAGLYGLYVGVDTNGTSWLQSARNDAVTYYDLALQANGGNVGIGTTDPGGILHTVGGDVKIGMGTFDNAGSSDDLYVTGNLEVDGSVWLGDATADNITITGTLIQEGGGTFGNIRIASTDDQTIDTANGLLVLDSMTDTLDINTSLIDLSTQATTITLADVVDALNIDSDTFTIDASNDRVGIGTATPEGILHVAETGGATSIYFDTYEASGARTQLYLRSSRSDTIGTASDTSDGDVLGDIRFTGVDSGNTFDTGAVIEAVQNGAASVKVPTDLRFYTSDSDSTDINMVIKSSGNVGIGTSLPSTTLDIDGTFSGTPSADTSIVAGTGVTVSKYVMKVQGDGGAVDITANPQITDGSDGQMVIIKGVSDTNTLKFDDGTGLALDSGISFTMGIGDLLHLMYDATEDIWYEISRTDN